MAGLRWPVLACACLAARSFRILAPRRASLARLHVGGLSCRITPISRKLARQIVPQKITVAQYSSYWGLNSIERVQKVFESVIVAYGGAWLAWFASFMVGSLISAVFGVGLVFNWIYTPWLNAKKRNSKIWPRSTKLHYALLTGRIESLSRLRRRTGKMIGAVSQEYLQLVVSDESNRRLEIITQWQEGYAGLRVQMKCETVIASPVRDFSELFTVTELWVPSSDCYVGDYPYLNRRAFESLVYSVEAAQLTKRNNARDVEEYVIEPDAIARDPMPAESSDGRSRA